MAAVFKSNFGQKLKKMLKIDLKTAAILLKIKIFKNPSVNL